MFCKIKLITERGYSIMRSSAYYPDDCQGLLRFFDWFLGMFDF